MMGLIFILAGTLAFIVVCIGPLWIIFHYIDRWKRMNAKGREGMSDGEARELRVLADKLEARVHSLEKLLDAEAVGWRDR